MTSTKSQQSPFSEVTTSTYNASNELTSSAEIFGNTLYTYDAAGNRRSVTSTAGERTTYTWDALNHLRQVELDDGLVVTHTWAPVNLLSDERQVVRDDGTDITRNLWDDQVLVQETDETNLVLARNFAQPGGYGALLTRQQDGELSRYHFDALGSTRLLTDQSGGVTDDYTYTPFGESRGSTGGTDNPYTWVGEHGYRLDPDTGEYNLRVRDYDPQAARFLSNDPLGLNSGDSNFYRYVFNNPVNEVDPSGLQINPVPALPNAAVPAANAADARLALARMRGSLERLAQIAEKISSRVNEAAGKEVDITDLLDEAEYSLLRYQADFLRLQQMLASGTLHSALAEEFHGFPILPGMVTPELIAAGNQTCQNAAQWDEFFGAAETATANVEFYAGWASTVGGAGAIVAAGGKILLKEGLVATLKYGGKAAAVTAVGVAGGLLAKKGCEAAGLSQENTHVVMSVASLALLVFARMKLKAKNHGVAPINSGATGAIPTNPLVARILAKLNLYPKVIDPRTEQNIPFPSGIKGVADKSLRVQWGLKDRAAFIAEWYRRGYSTPKGEWDKYDIHHIQPREFGGTNDFWNLVPVERKTHGLFNAFWREFLCL